MRRTTNIVCTFEGSHPKVPTITKVLYLQRPVLDPSLSLSLSRDEVAEGRYVGGRLEYGQVTIRGCTDVKVCWSSPL